ncbi:hypothetical protein CDL12_24726 [Handroanthus impetiginosus]|uniref:Bifunctional inhibitor/plant lipid transfer protein/seed storage helical domain-containing protein n=1 Tax=Handroanthus impetiginosus TaxID=429701 RepID=A0A2G9GBU4_9LAMI|nr:hypothetical protein CDL12_24726 [Handroanthus impetiginosus]
MAATKSVIPLVNVMLVVLALMITQSEAQSSTCSSSLANLNVCAPFVVPGATTPSHECCGALQVVDHECLCNTLRIAMSMPARCNLPTISCGNKYKREAG